MSVLICEVFDSPVSPIFEEIDGKKKLFVEGIYLQGGIKNRNGRIYPPHILEREVERYTKSHIEQNRAWGELDHPPSPSISLKNASHLVKSLKREGNDWIGKAEVADTPAGNIVKNLIEMGGNIGTSSRGLGSLKKDSASGAMLVTDDYHLSVAGDFVSDPSAPSAFVKGLMEGQNWIFDVGANTWKLEEEVDSIVREIHSTPKSQINEKSIAFFEKFLRKLSNS